MKTLRILFLTLSLSLSVWGGATVEAQCPMCKAAVTSEHNNTESKLAGGLNTGILYLFVLPYLVATTIGVIWYRKYKKGQKLAQEEEQYGQN